MNILGKLKGIRKEKLDTEQAKCGVSWIVRVAQAVAALVVLVLIIWALLPSKVESPAPVVVEKEVLVEVVEEVERPVVQTVVVEKGMLVTPTPVSIPTVVSTTIVSEPLCPLRGKLSNGTVIVCIRCYSRKDGDKCDYRTENLVEMQKEDFYTVDADKILKDLVWWEPVAEEALAPAPTPLPIVTGLPGGG